MSIEPAKVLDIAKVAEDTYHLRVKPVLSCRGARPFNFFMVWVPRTDEIPLCVAYYDGCTYSFLFKVRGMGTRSLSTMVPGSFIGLKGPLGRGFTIAGESKKILIVAGGIGIAPVPFFIARSKHAKIDVVWGVRKESELFDISALFPEIKERFDLVIATEDCSLGLCGTALDALRGIDLRKYDVVIAVGPTAMLREICNHVKGHDGIEAYVALETIVKCGMGLCGSCYIKRTDKLLCVDGPVFKCEEVVAHIGENPDSKGI